MKKIKIQIETVVQVVQLNLVSGEIIGDLRQVSSAEAFPEDPGFEKSQTEALG